ncbi:thiamine-triphosphatase [Hypomesus transpacificus]|uniref:thiamine-triphosphatase n=1 Tax=Hypomesus transpacificus TaxID=137520 RepID=UPI001F07A5BE|nr:thiamine-triphosphatase [Hypomesus transpacificus]
MSVEVERKFVCDADIQKRLEEVGAVCIGQCEFQDRYYDSADFHLTLRNVWLRCRQGSWELKYPTVTELEDRGGASLCSRYVEVTNLPQIQLKVREMMSESDNEPEVKEGGCASNTHPVHGDRACTGANESSPADHAWLAELKLVCFANYTTVRRSFGFKEEGVRVDLDQADFGYCVGEIEVIVPEGEDTQPALKTIRNTAQKLGLSGDQRVQGKMDVYLQTYCPEHYTKLLNAHIL